MDETFAAIAGFDPRAGLEGGRQVIVVTSQRTLFVPGHALAAGAPKDFTPQDLSNMAASPSARVVSHTELLSVKVKGKAGRGFVYVMKARSSAGGKLLVKGALAAPPGMEETDKQFRAMGLAGISGAIGSVVKRAYDTHAPKASK